MSRLRSDATFTIAGNLVGVGLTGALTLLLPRFLTATDYGIWQMYQFFCLYLGYVTFGVTDGIFQRVAGETAARIRSMVLASQLRIFATLLAITLALAAILFAALVSSGPLRMAFLLAVAASWFFCLRTFVTILWQARQQARRFAVAVVLERAIPFVLVVALLCLDRPDTTYLFVADMVGKIVTLVWCLRRRDRDIPYVTAAQPRLGVQEFCRSCSLGIPLLAANLAAAAIYGVVRLFVQAGWGIETFGRVSLALTLANMALVAINSVAIVLVPALRDAKDLSVALRSARGRLLIPTALALLCYFPAVWLVRAVVPQPGVTITSLAALFPLCVFEIRMRILGIAFLRALEKGRILMQISVATILVSLPLFYVAVRFSHLTTLLVTFVGILAARSLAAEWATARSVGAALGGAWAVEFAIVAIFLVTVLTLSWPIALTIHLAICTATVALRRAPKVAT